MKIAVFGSNPRAVAIGKLLVDAGYHVCFGDAAGMKPAEAAAQQAGAVADLPYNEAAVCDMLIFAGSREQIDELLAQAGCMSPHAVIVDAIEDGVGGDSSGSEMLARKLDTHRLVRALIALPQAGANIPYCGDDADAMTVVEEVFRSAGCITTYRGPLADAGQLAAPTSGDGKSTFEKLKSVNTVTT
jgi:predicted dinucleotide-binding enzyme